MQYLSMGRFAKTTIKKHRRWALSLGAIFFLLDLGVANARAKDSEVFERQREFLKQRYQDFFTHLDKAEKFDQEVAKGVVQYKKQQERALARSERARRAYLKERTQFKAYDTEELEQAWLKKQELAEKQREKKRQQFKKQQDRLLEISKSVKSIPEAAEVDLMSKEELEALRKKR